MESGLRLRCFAIVMALIILPATTFAQSNPSDSGKGVMPASHQHRVPADRILSPDNDAPLRLSLSLSVSRSSGNHGVKPSQRTMVSSHDMGGEPLFIPLSLSLSSLSTNSFIKENVKEVVET